TLNITNEHPFAQFLDNKGDDNGASLFPAVVITSETDVHAPPGSHFAEAERLTLNSADVDKLIEYGYLIDPETVEKIRNEFEGREKLYGLTHIIRRTERISIQIWAENIKLKNYLYEMIRLFVMGGLHESMEEYRAKNNLVIFDETVTGQRSGTYSSACGVTLAGANIVFDADYIIEQSFIDSELIELNKPVYVEVKHGTK
ncbi:MAG: hypothetical protein LBQ88_08665, partial [Treponema sp.]|nr:hypothetical protein [Treponema sp.]